jgi:hypothetical protein
MAWTTSPSWTCRSRRGWKRSSGLSRRVERPPRRRRVAASGIARRESIGARRGVKPLKRNHAACEPFQRRSLAGGPAAADAFRVIVPTGRDALPTLRRLNVRRVNDARHASGPDRRREKQPRDRQPMSLPHPCSVATFFTASTDVACRKPNLAFLGALHRPVPQRETQRAGQRIMTPSGPPRSTKRCPQGTEDSFIVTNRPRRAQLRN